MKEEQERDFVQWSKSLREQLEKYQSLGGRCEYPLELKREVLQFARAGRKHGKTVRGSAKELGLGEWVMYQWRIRNKALKDKVVGDKEVAFKPVQVKAARSACKGVVVSPSGYRVEGLSIEDIAHLLRDIG